MEKRDVTTRCILRKRKLQLYNKVTGYDREQNNFRLHFISYFLPIWYYQSLRHEEEWEISSNYYSTQFMKLHYGVNKAG